MQTEDRDGGSVSLWAVVLSSSLLLLAGLVYDGSTKLRAGREASSIADEAARAGAGLVDRSEAYATGAVTVDQAAAIRAATEFLAGEGREGTVTVDGNVLHVQVTVTKPAVLLSLIGIGDLSVTADATANLVSGIRTPQ